MTPSMTDQSTFTHPPAVLFQDLGDEGVALHLERGKYYGFDDVATRIWNLLAAGHSRSQIVETLLAEYAVERPQAERDLDALLAQLLTDGLLRVQESHKTATAQKGLHER